MFLSMLQVPPDFYIPDFDEDKQNPDERVDRKQKAFTCPYIYRGRGILCSAFPSPLTLEFLYFRAHPRQADSKGRRVL